MNVPSLPEQARLLADYARRIGSAARDVALFGESDPGLAAECGVECATLEARMILSGGAPARVMAAAAEAYRSGHPANVRAEDLDSLARLEGVISLFSNKVGAKIAAIDAAAAPSIIQTIAPVLGGIIVDRAIGLIKSIF